MTEPSKRLPPAPLIVGGVFFLHALFLIGMAKWLWSRDHYQYYPMVLGSSAIFAWYRVRGQTWENCCCLTNRVVVLGTISVLCFLAAFVFQSNWLGSLSAISCLLTLVWLYGGGTIADLLRGPLLLLLLAIPLPLNLDLQLIIGLQKIASVAASSLLDLMQIRHLVSGVTITTGNKDFLVEEACSGIHSLFSCICVVVFLCVLQRYSLLRILVNIVQTVGWVIVANVIRVFLIVYAFSNWQVSLDTGWQHEMLGAATYGLALILSLSTDRLFQFVVPLSRQGTDAFAGVYDASDGVLTHLLKWTKVSRKTVNEFMNKPLTDRRKSMLTVTGVILMLLAPLSAISHARVLFRLGASSPNSVGADAVIANMSQVLTDDALPASVSGWELVSVQRISRTPDDPLGTNSTIFTYSGAGLTAVFSVDGYYSDWHDLAYCYTGLGWQLQSQRNSIDHQSGYHCTSLELSSDDGRHAISMFSCFDSEMKTVRPGEATIGVIPTFELLTSRLPGGSDWSDTLHFTPPVFQLQLICDYQQNLLEHERVELRHLFQELCQQTIKSLSELPQ